MHKIEKQILFELNKELNEGILSSVRKIKDQQTKAAKEVGKAATGTAGAIKRMATTDPTKKEADPEEQKLLQTRIKPFVYPVSLMVAKFGVFAKEAEAASKEEGAQNIPQLERKKEIFIAIQDILNLVLDFIKPAADGIRTLAQFRSNAVNFFNDDSKFAKGITDLETKYEIKLTNTKKIQDKLQATYKKTKADNYAQGKLEENRNVQAEKNFIDIITNALKDFLRPLAVLTKKKSKLKRTKTTQTDLVQALDAKGIKEGRAEIIQLIKTLSTAKGGKFDIEEFLKDPIGKSKQVLDNPNLVLEDDQGDPAPDTGENNQPVSITPEQASEKLALAIAISYYSKKLEPIITKLPKNIKEDDTVLKSIKQNLAKSFITGNTNPVVIDLGDGKKATFNWTGNTFERKVEGPERFLKTKGMEGFELLNRFADLANRVVHFKRVEDFIKDPEPWMRQVAQQYYTDTNFQTDQDDTVNYIISENLVNNNSAETGQPIPEDDIKKLLYLFSAHKYSKTLKPIIIQLNKFDKDLDRTLLKNKIIPNILLSYLKGELKDFKVTAGNKNYNFTYTPAGKIKVKGLRDLEDWQQDVVDMLSADVKNLIKDLFNLNWETKKGKLFMLHQMLNTKETPNDFELKFGGKKNIKGPFYYLYNLAVIIKEKKNIKNDIIKFSSGMGSSEEDVVGYLNKFEQLVDNKLKEYFEFISDPSKYERGDQELYKKTIQFLNSELKEMWNSKPPTRPDVSTVSETKNINKKLELLINNYINQRKQQWQKRTM